MNLSVCQTLLLKFCINYVAESYQPEHKVDNFGLWMLQTRKLRHREVKEIARVPS